MIWFLLLMFVGALVGCTVWVWHIWRTRFADRSMDYDSRELAFLAEAQAIGQKAPEDNARLPPLNRMPVPTPAVAAQLHQAPAAQKKHLDRPPTLLDEDGRAIYIDLKSCLGDYPLTVGVDVARLLAGSQIVPPRTQIDYLVCRKDFTPVVAVFLNHGTPDPLRDRAAELLKQCRIRILHWDAHNPPDRETMRQQVFKQKSPAEQV